jgi:hypothetical protein
VIPAGAHRIWPTAGRILCLAALVVALVPGTASAYFIGTLASGSNASTTAGTLPQASTPTAVASGSSVTVSWTQNTVGGQSLGSYAGGSYTVQRYASTGGSAITPGSACNSSVSGASTTLTCTETSVPPGIWYYKITPVLNSWTGPQSAQSSTVTVGASSDTVTASANPDPLGGSVTYKATVSGAGATPTGTVTFQDGGTAISGCGTAGVVTLSGGVATCTVSYRTAGPHTITAPYSGDSNYMSAPGNSVSETVSQGTPTDTVSSSPASGVVGQAVTYTATVGGPGATPTGSVTFMDGGTPISGCGSSGVVTLSGGVVTCTVTYSTAGSHTITAPYSGDGNYMSVTGNSVSETVSQATPTDTVSSSQNPVPANTQVTYKATVAGAGATPTGTVTFKDGGTPIAGCGTSGVVTLSSGVASCSVTYAATGSHTITAAYSGDGNYTSVAGNTLAQAVGWTSATALTSNYNPIAVNASVTFTATASGSNGTPTGSVTFKDGGTVITSCGTNGVVTLSAGVATCTVSYTAAATHSITSTYGGSATYMSSTSTTLSQVVSTDSNTLTQAAPNTPKSLKDSFTGTASASTPVTVYYCTGSVTSCTSSSSSYVGSLTATPSGSTWTTATVTLSKGTAYTSQAYQTDPLGAHLVSGIQQFTA